MPQDLIVTVIHKLEGRIRLRLSLPLKSVSKMQSSVKAHPGITSVNYTSITRSVLVYFEPDEVQLEEIIIRTSLSFSLDYGALPVRVLAQPEVHDMTDSAFYSGLLIVCAMINRVVNNNSRYSGLIEGVAGAATVGAVLEHGWGEVARRGNFDPEALSVVYLITALLRGNFLPATIFTWATTFGRHLVNVPTAGVCIKPIEISGKKDKSPRYELVVTQDKESVDRMALFTMLPSVILNALTGGHQDASRGRLLEEIRNVSKLHGEVLEGLGEIRSGIPVKIN